MTAEALAGYLLSVMLSVSPPGKSRHPAPARETAEQGRARYEQIARALAEVTLDPDEAPVFAGAHGRERTAALLLAISWHESAWRRDVDLGLGREARGGGRYACLMQVAVDRGKTPEGWTAADLFADRARCFRAGLHVLVRGRRICKADDPAAWLASYTSGRCTAGDASRKRLSTFRQWITAHPLPDA